MKRIISLKRFFVVISLSVVFCISFLSSTAWSKNTTTAKSTNHSQLELQSNSPDKDIFGKSIKWTYDKKKCILTISGKGAMEDWNGDSPWWNTLGSKIKKL